MNKQERDALKKLEKVMAKRLDIMLTITETMAKLCEAEIQALEGVRILARQPEGVEHEPTPKIDPEPEEYDGYVSYSEFIEQPENRRVLKGRIRHVERPVPTEYVEEHDGNLFPDYPVRAETPYDEVLEATPEEWAEYERLERQRREQDWGWIG